MEAATLIDVPAAVEPPGRTAAARLPPAARPDGLTGHRLLSLLGAAALFGPAFDTWSTIVGDPSIGAVSIALTAGLLVMVCLIAMARDEERLSRLDVWLLVLGGLVLLAWMAAKLHAQSGYSTDEASFEQGAANLLLHGHDPYGRNLTSSLYEFGTPARFWTYTMNGGAGNAYGYPSLPVLLVAPFVALTGNGQAVPMAGIVALLASVATVFFALPRPWRPAALIACAGFPALAAFALSGLTAVLMLPAMLAVAFRWTSVGIEGRLGRGGRWRAIALGAALATNQLAWFIAPFVVCGLFILRSPQLGRRAAAGLLARYVGIAVGVFVSLNAPFLLADPGSWLNAIVSVATQHALPYGQGLVGLSVFLGMGGGRIDAFAWTGTLTYLALLAVYLRHPRTLARCCFVLPVLALFVSGRSLSEYWMALLPVWVVSFAAPGPGAAWAPIGALGHSRGFALRRLRDGLLFAPAAGCLLLALATPQPLTLGIVSARSNPITDSVSRLTVAARNTSGDTLLPHFAVNSSGQATPFWRVLSGPRTIRPHAVATYVLEPPQATAAPGNGVTFLLQAVTDSPRTISSSGRFAQPGPVQGSW